MPTVALSPAPRPSTVGVIPYPSHGYGAEAAELRKLAHEVTSHLAKRAAYSLAPVDVSARYARALALLDKWTSENAEFDARVDPLIEKALRETAPRHFPEP